MAAAATDSFMEVGDPGSATNLAGSGYTIGATSITVTTTTNWPTNTGVIFGIDTVETDANGNEVRVDGSYCIFQGVVTSATTIGSVSKLYGDDQDYAAGATTRVYITVSTEHTNRMVQALLSQHKQTGAHGAVTADSLTATGTVQGASLISTGDIQHRSISLETIRGELEFDFVASGCVWSGDSYGSTRAASMTSGVVYIGGKRVAVSTVTARSFTASKDTYIDVDNTGTITYTEVTNNAASPALSANNIRLGIIVTGASNIANVGSVNQGQEDKVLPIASSIAYTTTDSLGNLICPRDPKRTVLGYRQILADQGSITSAVDVTGLSCPVLVPANRRIKITGFAGMTNGTSDAYSVLYIFEGASQLQIAGANSRSGSTPEQFRPEKTYFPSAGLHTYKIVAQGSGGTSTVRAGSNAPAFILVELA